MLYLNGLHFILRLRSKQRRLRLQNDQLSLGFSSSSGNFHAQFGYLWMILSASLPSSQNKTLKYWPHTRVCRFHEVSRGNHLLRFQCNHHIDNNIAKAKIALGFLRRNFKVRWTKLKEKSINMLVWPIL